MLSVCLNQGAVIPVLALVTSRSLDEIAIKAFLQQAGYLAIKHVDSDDMATLGVPNQEVAVSLPQLIFDLCAQMVTVTPFGGSVGNFVSRTIITGGQSSKVAHFLYGFSAGFGVCGGGGGGAHA